MEEPSDDADRARTGARSADRPVSRRRVLGAGGAAVAATLVPATSGAEAAARRAGSRSLAGTAQATGSVPQPDIRPRDDWGADLPVTGAIVAEDDVRFLLVHHTASTNDYGPDQVADQIRSFYRLHTGPEKGWPDVAYNFFVDRFGTIWEARAGSIAGPVRGDATGGSQGFALLCSLIGDHSQAPVTAEARRSLVSLLAWLADRHGIETTPGTAVDFVSRGSNLWPAGQTVTAATISGHRDMSQTACPGDFAYDLLALDVPQEVTAVRAAVTPTTTGTTVQDGEPPSTEPSTSPSTLAGTTPAPGADQAAPASGTDSGSDSGSQRNPLFGAGAVLFGVAAAAVLGLRSRVGRARS